MTLRLQGTTGFTEVTAPAAAGNNTLTLPTSNGSANQYLANVSTTGELTFVTPPGSFTSYAIICDKKTDSTAGGTFTSGSWVGRELQTEIADPDNIVSIASDRFTLQAGSYLIQASAPAIEVNRHQTRLYDVTNSAVKQYGSNEYSSNAAGYAVTRSMLEARVTITGATAYEIQHRCEDTVSGFGFGVNNNFGGESIYTIVSIFKEA